MRKPAAGWLFKHYLALLIAMIAIPLVASVAYQLHLLRELQQRMAEDTALGLAQSAAARVAGFLGETQQTAALLARRPQVRSMQPQRCEPLLRELYAVLPLQANASVLDLNRNFVCSARPVPVRAPPPAPPRHSAFERAVRGEPSVSEPARGILSQWLAVAAHPVSDDAGTITGVVILPIDLVRLDPLAGAHAIPAGTVATVVTGEGNVVAQSADAERWIGRDLRDAPLLGMTRGLQRGTLTAAGFDGVERIYGVAPVAGPGWRVFVGVPAASLLAGAREDFRLMVLFAVLLVMLLALGTAGVVRRLAKPVADMAAALKAEPAGSYDARLPEAGPRELADLARAFNAAFAAVRAQALEVRQLSLRMSTVEEDERRVIHRELHDQIGASLSALKLELGALDALLAQDSRETGRARLRGAQQLADDAIHRTRNVMAELRPPALDDYGLVAALRVSAESQSARLGMSVKVSGADLAPRPAPVAETALFRIAQEALNNIAKHARARRVEVSVLATDGRVTLVVADDGVGFDADADPPRRDSWGLKTMRERAQAAGATLRVESSPGKGTRVVIELPPAPA